MTCQSYFICTTPRSGSTLLCGMLAATGVAGNPDSHFHKLSLAAWLSVYGLLESDFSSQREQLKAVFAAAMRTGRGESNLFGLRLQRGSLDFFIKQLATLAPSEENDLARINAVFGQTRFIYLTRFDKVDQAVSLLRAEQSGLWHKAADGTELERLSCAGQLRYDGVQIGRNIAENTAQEGEWLAWFASEGINPLVITYDQLAQKPLKVLGEVLNHLGLDPVSARNVDVPTSKLADELSEEWVHRYRCETTGGGGYHL